MQVRNTLPNQVDFSPIVDALPPKSRTSLVKMAADFGQSAESMLIAVACEYLHLADAATEALPDTPIRRVTLKIQNKGAR